MSAETPEPGMVKEEIILPDGRYLIYYTFSPANEAGDSSHPEALEG